MDATLAGFESITEAQGVSLTPQSLPFADHVGQEENCHERPSLAKMDSMDKKREMRTVPQGDARLAAAAKYANYRDQVGDLSDAQRAEYRDKVLAVLCDTGEIVAAASSIAELRSAVASAGYANRPWRLVDGPTAETSVPLSEVESLCREGNDE